MITPVRFNSFQTFQAKPVKENKTETEIKEETKPQKKPDRRMQVINASALAILAALALECPKNVKTDYQDIPTTSYSEESEQEDMEDFENIIEETTTLKTEPTTTTTTTTTTTKAPETTTTTTKPQTTKQTTHATTKKASLYKQVKSIKIELAHALDRRLGNGFSTKVESIAKKIKCNPNDLLAIMYSESGINPHLQGYNGATGLIQFLEGTAKELGTTTTSLKNMSAIEQLDYVEKFFRKNKTMFLKNENVQLDAGTLYSLCFTPARAKNEVQCEENGVLSWAYSANSGVDINHDGKITKTDLTVRMNDKYKEMYSDFV